MTSKIKAPVIPASQFTATEFTTAAEKSAYLTKLCNWLIRGATEGGFSNALYKGLSLHFGHIAHYNKYGFYGVWFDNPVKRYDFAQYHAKRGIYGYPQFTWSDVEREFKAWLIDSGILEIWEQEAMEYADAVNERLAVSAVNALSPERRAELIASLTS